MAMRSTCMPPAPVSLALRQATACTSLCCTPNLRRRRSSRRRSFGQRSAYGRSAARLSTCNGRSTANCRPSRLLAATFVKVAALAEAHAIADEDADFCRRRRPARGRDHPEISGARRPTGQYPDPLRCPAGWPSSITARPRRRESTRPTTRAWPCACRWMKPGPRNQGARLTAWEMVQQGVPHHHADDVGGHLRCQHASSIW